MTWISAALAWGTIRIFVTMKGDDFSSRVPHEVLKRQSEWKFGQVVPVVLLALPLVAFFGILAHFQSKSTRTDVLFQKLFGRLHPLGSTPRYPQNVPYLKP